ncbi:MAG: hypothetical protein WAV78_28825, partial [Xanthobacteraceae bacterium]
VLNLKFLNELAASNDRNFKFTALGQILALFDAPKELLQLLRGLRVQICIVHTSQLLADGKQCLGPQVHNVVFVVFFLVAIVRCRHF